MRAARTDDATHAKFICWAGISHAVASNANPVLHFVHVLLILIDWTCARAGTSRTLTRRTYPRTPKRLLEIFSYSRERT